MPVPTFSPIERALREFADAVRLRFASTVAAQPEEQLKAPVEGLLAAMAALLGRRILPRPAAAVSGLGIPDLGIEVDGLLSGHIELKAPGKGADPSRFRVPHDQEQWERFKGLPNLMYTDGSEFGLYRGGVEVGLVQLMPDICTGGAAAVSAEAAVRVTELFASLLSWDPIVPTSPRALAELLAPLCRILRDDVQASVQRSDSGLSRLAADWRQLLFPDADDAQFADAYAQTVTYALLLARFSGGVDMGIATASDTLSAGHALLAQALRMLGDPQVMGEIGLGAGLLQRAIGAVDPAALGVDGDPWLYFYEHFLASYDPRLRNNRGVYYTPAQVVHAQVALVAELLRERLSKPLSFAEESVLVLDPGVGTGTYLLAVVGDALDRVDNAYGEGAEGAFASSLAKRVHGFEILVGPYAVAHLRVTQRVLAAGGELPLDGVHIYLTDTLESPHAAPGGQASFFHRKLSEEHERARVTKAQARVVVCIGNPPYDRQEIASEEAAIQERKGGWVRFGDPAHPEQPPLFEDFLRPVREAGLGVHAKNLYNDYVYFWRWALWKVFETTEEGGVVSFISASSYLRGPGFVGVREHMRRTLDELWIIDLEGDNLGPRRTENVFDIQTPVAIAVGLRVAGPNREAPARVWYTKVTGSREEKLNRLAAIESADQLTWQECPSGWHDPFLPRGVGDYESWPLLTDLLPWQHSGSQLKRTWPIGETREVLVERWAALVRADPEARGPLFRETRDRAVGREYPSLDDPHLRLPSLHSLNRGEPAPPLRRYGFRSLDRQWVFADSRLGDFLRPVLWRVHGPRQIYLTSLLTTMLGDGSAAMVCAHVPDLHHFRGSFGGKDAIPLWRDPAGTVPNVTPGLLEELSRLQGAEVNPEALFAYIYGILSSPRYVEGFRDELEIPGPRIPLTRNATRFQAMSDLGRKLICLHTYGERMAPSLGAFGRVPQGAARCTVVAVPAAAADYPTGFSYDPATRVLTVGGGRFEPVRPDVWSYSVSGFYPLRSWLAFRKRDRAGRSSSPLDEIRPSQWTAELTRELLELLWVLEHTIDLLPSVDALLAEILDSEAVAATELPSPSVSDRAEPSLGSAQGELELGGG